jgi:hypothetical protein
MPCTLQRGDSGVHDFLGGAGKTYKLRVVGTNGAAGIVRAEFNNAVLAVQNSDMVSFTLKAGDNNLVLLLALSVPGDTVKLVEDCGEGEEKTLRQFPTEPTDPIAVLTILGS